MADVRKADARAVALRILCTAESSRRPSDQVRLPALGRSELDARARRLVTTLVQTTYRWQGRADRVLDARLDRGVASLDVCTRNILRLAYVQLFHLDQIPEYAAVDTAVSLARRQCGSGKARLVNRILRGLTLRRPDPEEWAAGAGIAALAGELSHPGWLLERWIARWGLEETRRICAWNNRIPEFHLRVMGGPEGVAAALDRLRARGLDASPGRLLEEAVRVCGTFDAAGDSLVQEGGVTIQDESQMLVGRLWPEPEAGPAVDLCAAPGTKASHLAALLPHDSVFAGDATLGRVRAIAATARRLGLPNLFAFVADGRRPPLRPIAARVLVDAPCTSLGVLQRRPDARWQRGPEQIPRAARLQEALLAGAARLVRPGGWLLYSVCTLEPEETEHQARRFLARQPRFTLQPVPAWVPEEIRGPEGTVRVLPGVLGMEGLYAALFRRQA